MPKVSSVAGTLGAIVIPRVAPLAAPTWALGGSYPGDFAKAIALHLPPNNGRFTGDPALVDVLIDQGGNVLVASAREQNPQTSPTLMAEALDAVRAASPFHPIPSSSVAVSIQERSFVFSVRP